jgi:CspA family cold shock protein
MNVATGVMKMFSTERGCGFINPDEAGPGLFLHVSALPWLAIKHMAGGARLSFEVVRSGRTYAEGMNLLEFGKSEVRRR